MGKKSISIPTEQTPNKDYVLCSNLQSLYLHTFHSFFWTKNPPKNQHSQLTCDKCLFGAAFKAVMETWRPDWHNACLAQFYNIKAVGALIDFHPSLY